MEEKLKVTGETIKWKALLFKHGMMVGVIEVILKTMLLMVTVFTNGQMDLNMTVPGKMENNMEVENTECIRMPNGNMVYGMMENFCGILMNYIVKI